jgi:hypothetical protein
MKHNGYKMSQLGLNMKSNAYPTIHGNYHSLGSLSLHKCLSANDKCGNGFSFA